MYVAEIINYECERKDLIILMNMFKIKFVVYMNKSKINDLKI